MTKDIVTQVRARLPQVYEEAKTALANCEHIDECKSWVDKASALASYARQAEDTTLLHHAMRIQAWAIRRAGELLEQIEPQSNANLKQNRTEVTHRSVSRTSAAREAGLSEHQQKQAMRLSRIPEDEFNERVDSVKPPTMTELSTPHVTKNSGNNEWYTPHEFVDSVKVVLGKIDLDPASNEKANTIIKAETFYTEDDDGLSMEWGGRIFMNPPYSSALIKAFCDKFVNSKIEEGIVLVNNATETGWFQSLLSKSDAICLVEGRIKYLDDTLSAANTPLQGQAFLYFGNHVTKFSKEFKSHGQVLFHA